MRRPPLSLVVIAAGLGILALGGLVELAPWYQATQWQASPEAARAERNAAAPTLVLVTPTALTAAPPVVTPATQPTPAAPPPTAAPLLSTPIAFDAQIAPQPTPTPSASDLRITSSAFAFDDPPEPGAHAHLDLTVTNPGSEQDQLVVAIPTAWLAGYRLETLNPSPTAGEQSNGELRLTFDGPPAQSDLALEFHFVTTDEVIDSPVVTVVDGEGRSVGSAHPATEAPPAPPGPIYSIDIPRLKLHSGVVPVDWEPPLFVVGQLRTSAWVTRGNSVLVGHVRGAAGYNVFIHLDELEPGDVIVANSRGQPYTFIVSDKQVLPEDDTSPTAPSRGARLTLMTCAGDWNPLTQDYSDRLWIMAKPQANDAVATPPW